MQLQKYGQKPSWLSPAYILTAATIVVALFYLGYIVGNLHGARSAVPEGEGRVLNQGDLSVEIGEDLDFRSYWDIWNLVKEAYVEQPVSEVDMFYGSLAGMVQALGDPYSVYYDPEQADEFNQELDGTFSGIGAEIDKKDDKIVVVAPLSGSPAEEAGLLSGDEILAVDGEDLYGLSATEAVYLIRGEKGTEVTLTLARQGVDDQFEITITRGEIKIDSVDWEIRDDNIAVINVYMFNDDTTTLFQEAVQEILTADVDGIVLDLRNNPGGLLTEAVNLAGFWIDGQVVVKERVGDKERSLAASGVAQLAGIETIVLVNGGSASGSEILAGALQDYGVATLIGEQTFGKGSVQELYEFTDGSALKITVAEWLTPEGRSINKVGITPDIIVEYSLEDYEEGNTPQFDAAIRELTR